MADFPSSDVPLMPRILIAEETLAGRDPLAGRLRAEGFEVLTAQSGGESLRLASEQPPDLLILNLKLPGLDDQSLADLLHRCAQVPILMRLTRPPAAESGPAAEADADQLNALGAGELLARVHALLRRSPGDPVGQITHLQSGDLALDLITRRVTLAQRSLKLTRKEFDLLTELVRNQGVTLSRDLLLTRVWGNDRRESDHTVDVHIRWLREKIEPNPAVPCRIITLRRVGYRFAQ